MSISSVNGINEGKNASAENEVCQCHGAIALGLSGSSALDRAMKKK